MDCSRETTQGILLASSFGPAWGVCCFRRVVDERVAACDDFVIVDQARILFPFGFCIGASFKLLEQTPCV